MKNTVSGPEPFDATAVNTLWSRERAARVGWGLYSVSLPLAVASSALNFAYGNPMDGYVNVLLALGLGISLLLSRSARPGEFFYWWPGYLAFWIAVSADLWETGGIGSPFLGLYMALMLVVALFVQTRVRPPWVLLFICANLLGWLLLGHYGTLPPPRAIPPSYSLFAVAILVGGMASCLFVYLRIEREMAAEILHRAQQLADARAELAKEESASSAKSTFIANVSHELRTPLGAILGFSELLLRKADRAQAATASLETIHKNGLALAKLVDDLLDISKIEAGKIEIEKRDFRPAEILDDTIGLLALSAAKKQVSLGARHEGVVPERLVADHSRVKQILINIVGNAIKYTDAGRVDVSMRYAPEPVGTLEFRVADTGRGLAPGEESKLFKPFSQVDVSVSREFGGTGLGLALSRKLARLMGGDVVLESSQRGRGSVFLFRLPAEIPTPPEAPSLPSATDGAVNLAGRRILVIDDTIDNQDMICYFLQNAGASTLAVGDGMSGVQAALAADYDVVLMDVQMPVMDGLRATKELREKGFRRPVIALTAHAMKEDRQRCLAAGCDDYLPKPIDWPLLLHTIQSYAHRAGGP